MDTLKARVAKGRLVMDEPCDLPEGTILDLVIDDGGDELDAEERRALHSALDHAWLSVQGGERGVPAADVLSRLRQGR